MQTIGIARLCLTLLAVGCHSPDGGVALADTTPAPDRPVVTDDPVVDPDPRADLSQRAIDRYDRIVNVRRVYDEHAAASVQEQLSWARALLQSSIAILLEDQDRALPGMAPGHADFYRMSHNGRDFQWGRDEFPVFRVIHESLQLAHRTGDDAHLVFTDEQREAVEARYAEALATLRDWHD